MEEDYKIAQYVQLILDNVSDANKQAILDHYSYKIEMEIKYLEADYSGVFRAQKKRFERLSESLECDPSNSSLQSNASQSLKNDRVKRASQIHSILTAILTASVKVNIDSNRAIRELAEIREDVFLELSETHAFLVKREMFPELLTAYSTESLDLLYSYIVFNSSFTTLANFLHTATHHTRAGGEMSLDIFLTAFRMHQESYNSFPVDWLFTIASTKSE